MNALVGDEVFVESHRLRGGRRRGTIAEVLGAPDHEYYRVRWDDGRETIFHPGPDAVLRPKARRPRKGPAPQEKREEQRQARPAPPTRTEKAVPSPQRPKAAPGDRFVIHGHHLGEADRDAEILEVLGPHGGPPFRVRWSDTGRVTTIFPGSDASVEHFPRRRSRRR